MSEVSDIRNTYIKMCDAMIAKDGEALNEILSDDFVLIHMTGMRQSKDAFIGAVLDGTLNYYSAVHENMDVSIKDEKAILTGQSVVSAAVFGGRRSSWHLKQRCDLIKACGKWRICQSTAGIY